MMDVYSKKELCCGCGLCASVCPKSAIEMKEDELGIIYPIIDHEKCINCNLCRRKCPFVDNNVNKIKECYAAMNEKKAVLKKSASGSMFGALAEDFLDKKGDVCGAEMYFKEGHVNVRHSLIESPRDLEKLQGSKYVQSDTRDIYLAVMSKLKEGKKVFFSGTPCQVAAIKNFVGDKFVDNLFTVDLICHGVPSLKMFDDYIQQVAMKKKILIHKFNFRDKRFGWGLDGSIEGIDDQGNEFFEQISPNSSSYYRFFLDGEIYRESCYHCPFAREERVGDLTIGDYWGVEKYSPELLKENGGLFLKKEGISCLFVNTDKGKKMLEIYGNSILKEKVDIEKIKIVNTQLTTPAESTKLRKTLMRSYLKKGYKKIETIFFIKSKKDYIKWKVKETIKKILPGWIVNIIKNS